MVRRKDIKIFMTASISSLLLWQFFIILVRPAFAYQSGLTPTNENNSLLISSCPNDYCVYLPYVGWLVPEIILSPGRWHHTPGQQVNISYKWAGELTNPYHTWRPAFQNGITDWNNSPTLINFYYNSGSNNTINVFIDPERDKGFTKSLQLAA